MMISPITFINNFITDYKTQNTTIDVEGFKNKLYNDYKLMSKYYEEDNLMIVYHKYELPTNSNLEQECRSLVINMTNLQVISYTCPNPILNKKAQEFLLNNTDLELEINECYEGSILSLFHHNSKWYLSTRRCLDCRESTWNDTNYYDMFMDVLINEGLTFDEFTSELNTDYGYYFILIHHKNQNIINYTNKFGENYTKLCVGFVRSKDGQYNITDYGMREYNHIFKPRTISIDEFGLENQTLKTDIDKEGIIIKTFKNNKYYLFKLQTITYQFYKAIGPESNIFKGYVYLYQNDKLKDFITTNKEHKTHGKIINPNKTNEIYDTIGVIDCVFKVFTSELFELYKLLYDISNNSNQLNSELYKILPKEYKDILFLLKGIYKKLKPDRKLTFGIKNIYQCLKTLNVEQFCALLRQRKLMINWTKHERTPELMLYKTISNNCDKVHLKLITIYTNILFPGVMHMELP